MNGLDNETYRWLLLASNVVAVILLLFAVRWPTIARFLFFGLFAWASYTNFHVSQSDPLAYLEYAELTWSHWYSAFIKGWFSAHIKIAVGFIAFCQALIALAMLMRGWIYRLGVTGGIIFLLCIVPLGTGSGFPAPVILSVAMFILVYKKNDRYVWQFSETE